MMIWIIGSIALILALIGVIVSIVAYDEYYESLKSVHKITFDDEDSGQTFKYSNDETRNIKVSFKDFEPLYRGNRKEWGIVKRGEGDLIPFYIGLYESEKIVYFVHFKIWKDYRKFKKKYNPNKGKDTETELAYEKIAGDVSDKIRTYLDEVESKRAKAMEDMDKTLKDVKLRLQGTKDTTDNYMSSVGNSSTSSATATQKQK